MSQSAWRELCGWLTRVFGPVEGAEMYAAQVEEARGEGLELPADGEDER